MRKCRVGKAIGSHYRNYADMFETMSLLDIVAWTVGTAAFSAAVGYVFGKIAEYACDKIGGDFITEDSVKTYAEKHTEDIEK